MKFKGSALANMAEFDRRSLLLRMISSIGLVMFRFPAGSAATPLSFPVGLDATKRFFVDHSGEPCFACGDTPYCLIEQLSRADIELYLSDRASRGINVLWMSSADKIYQSNPPNNLAGDAPFTGADFTNFNSAYWNYVDYVMQRCLANGITVLFNPAFIGTTARGGYYSSFYNSSTTVLQGYAAFLTARYQSYPNLIWLLGGDADPNNSRSYSALNAFAVAIKSSDPSGHLMTLEASRGYSSVDAHTIAYGSVQSWLDINWVYQSGPTVTSGAQRCYSQGKPCLLGEDWYELEHTPTTTAQFLRQEGYGAVLGGCTLGRLFGNGAIWPFNSPNSGNGITSSPTWQSQLGSDGSIGLQLLGKLFRSRSHQLLVPDISNSVMMTGATNGSVCARTSDGKTIIVYLPSSQTVAIIMSEITDASGQANCNWFNPSTGAVIAIGKLANSGTHNFTSPDSNDWVLVIDSAEARLRAPGT